MDTDADMIPSSPSAETSLSSSSSDDDPDTESTGSFFPDRSTTLGTLMGVSFADGQHREARREVGEERERPRAPAPEEEGRRWRRRRRGRGGGWWRLCRDDVSGGPPTSLGEFLDMERQLSGAGFLCGDGGAEREAMTPLFEDGRMRPATVEERGSWKLRRSAQGSSSLARLPVLLTAICSGGAG